MTFRLFDIQNPYISTVFGVTVFALVCIAQKPAKSDKKYRNQENPIPVLVDAEVLSGLFAYSDCWGGRTARPIRSRPASPCIAIQSPGACPCTLAYDPLYPLYQGSQCRQGDNHRRN